MESAGEAAVTDPVQQLHNQYSEGVYYHETALLLNTDEEIENTGFFGSSLSVTIISKDSIEHDAPACIAGKIVSMRSYYWTLRTPRV